MTLALPVWIHIASALSALVLGTALLSRRLNGDRLHRIAGWAWVVLMFIARAPTASKRTAAS